MKKEKETVLESEFLSVGLKKSDPSNSRGYRVFKQLFLVLLAWKADELLRVPGTKRRDSRTIPIFFPKGAPSPEVDAHPSTKTKIMGAISLWISMTKATAAENHLQVLSLSSTVCPLHEWETIIILLSAHPPGLKT